MKTAFYLSRPFRVSALLLLLACSKQPEPVAALSLDEIFTPAPGAAPHYEMVGQQQMFANHLRHIHVGSKEQHRFATQMLLQGGSEAASLVAEELRNLTGDNFLIGAVVSCCQILSDIGDAKDADAVLPFTSIFYPPIVRTSAYQCLAQIGDPSLAEHLIGQYEHETESSPRDACLNAMSQGGSDAGLDFVASLVDNWLRTSEDSLQSSWNALLLCSNPRLVQVLKSFEERLAPFQALQAYGVRISLGDRTVANDVLKYLDSEKYPSGGTRSLAVQLLGELQQWDAVLAVAPANDEKIDLAIIALLSRDDAPASGVSILDMYTQNDLPSIRRQALAQMLRLGKQSYLDSYLLELQDYPFTPGSLLALSMLTDMQGLPRHVVDIMTARFENCTDDSHKLGLVRALVRTGHPLACDYLGEMMLAQKESPAVLSFISEVLGNSGPQSVDWFIKKWQGDQSENNAITVFSALSRYASMPRVEKLFVDTATSNSTLPIIRLYLLGMLPKIYPYKIPQWFSDWRDKAEHLGLRAYYNHTLNSYY